MVLLVQRHPICLKTVMIDDKKQKNMCVCVLFLSRGVAVVNASSCGYPVEFCSLLKQMEAIRELSLCFQGHAGANTRQLTKCHGNISVHCCDKYQAQPTNLSCCLPSSPDIAIMVKTLSKSSAPKSSQLLDYKKAPKIIKIGSDFSGIDSAVTAMHRMFGADKYRVMFSSDLLQEAHKLVAHKPCNKPINVYTNVLDREIKDVPGVDVYVWTPPCQSFSVAGKQGGLKDPRGSVLSAGLKYIDVHRPRVTIFENVAGLMTKKFENVRKGITKTLEDRQYNVFWKKLDARDYQVPQARVRVFMVGIRADSMRHPFKWPAPVTPRMTLMDIIQPMTSSDRPGRLPKQSSNAKCFVKEACKQAMQRDMNPLKIPIAVDIDCSARFQTVGFNEAKTLTRTRGSQGGPWITTRGRRTTPTEMMAIMGFVENELPWEEAGLTARQLGQLLGNAVAVPVIGHVLSAAMFSGGVTAAKVPFPFVKMDGEDKIFWDGDWTQSESD